jgi:hypothetical protein
LIFTGGGYTKHISARKRALLKRELCNENASKGFIFHSLEPN